MPDADLHLEHYATALLALGHATGELQKLCAEFCSVAELIDGNAQIRHFLADPRINTTGKRNALEELLEGQVSSAVLTLVLVMQQSNHLADIGELSELLCSRISSLSGKAAGELISAAPLSDRQVAANGFDDVFTSIPPDGRGLILHQTLAPTPVGSTAQNRWTLGMYVFASTLASLVMIVIWRRPGGLDLVSKLDPQLEGADG
jgi:hypothetical protein